MTADTDPTWAALIARLRANDHEALRELMQAEYQPLVTLAYHYVRTPDLACDVAQEAFIRLWERRHLLQDDMRLIAYLRRIAHHIALKLLARDAATARMEQSLLGEYTVVRPHEENLGLHTAESEEFNQRVRAVFATLTPRVREIALLYHDQGLEPAEIAELLSVALPTVYGALRKTMRTLGVAFGSRNMGPKKSR